MYGVSHDLAVCEKVPNSSTTLVRYVDIPHAMTTGWECWKNIFRHGHFQPRKLRRSANPSAFTCNDPFYDLTPRLSKKIWLQIACILGARPVKMADRLTQLQDAIDNVRSHQSERQRQHETDLFASN
jgi:hypothetical protein